MRADPERAQLRGRQVWSVLIVWALVLLALPGPAAAASGNILLVLADDFGVDLAPFYSYPDRIETTPPAPPLPNLTALAQAGIRFRRAWAAPSCSPTRAGILTGRLGFRTGIGAAKKPGRPTLALEEVTLPEVFAAAAPGYVLAHVGKWHLSNGLTDPNLQGWSHYAGLEPGLGGINYTYWNKVVDGTMTRSRTYATTDIVNEAIAVIQAARQQDRPFFLWVGLISVHAPYHKPPNDLHSRDYLPDRGAADRDYLEAMAEAMDAEVGRLLREVDLARTTVIFLGDNGSEDAVIAPPYDRERAKGTVYQAGVQVPLVIAGEKVKTGGRAVVDLVQTTDLFPTILELGGIAPNQPLLAGVKTDGISLMPYLRYQRHPNPRRWLYAEDFEMRFDEGWQRSIRNFQYTLIERFDGSREFYNLTADPLQKDDLLTRPLSLQQQRALTALDLQLDRIVADR